MAAFFIPLILRGLTAIKGGAKCLIRFPVLGWLVVS